ncbi:DUF6457 domain-containing protein [Naasia lichenicola]|uniref:Molybdopterin-guanine dinucleotide biosynthesis protein n=1 Tax=Naasia lichenicola TaxID=2565933 RepID=A0A4S4FI27_9MICO|nr:DUF6457 domain-containing protein [Naasia lichenicola]THG29960.1 molybdopterin-guanine dinucleotide biosynthesis protein [Naasia lichenicola]
MTEKDELPDGIAEWNRRLSDALGVPPADASAVLGMAGVVARAVVRPAAPLSAYLVGYATALAADSGLAPDEAFAQAVAVARSLAREVETETAAEGGTSQ